MKVVVWSEDKGQDDLKWYSLSSDGQLHVPYANHSGYGKYQVHAYLQKDGQSQGLTTTTVDFQQPKLSSTVTKVTDTQYKISISQVPSYMTRIQVPVWSENGGQDDLRWYQATPQGNGTYTAITRLSNHYYTNGNYQVHVYYDLANE